MKIFLYLAFILLTVNTVVHGQKDTIASRIVLIGDAGTLQANGHHPVVEAVRKMIPLDSRTTIVYLGDNLYRTGLPDDQYAGYLAAKAVLDTQLSVADGTDAKIYMIPGNHDWKNGGRDGWETVIREQIYVDQLGKKNVKYYPENGCPGPVEVALSKDVTLVIFDSQWWIHPYDKPEIESDCDYKTKDEVLLQLDDIFAKNSKKLVILACHHTFKSSGVHGGYYTWKQHIFPFTDINPKLYIPLPILGTIYPIERSIFGSPQDLKHPFYVDMISQVQSVVKKHPNLNLIFAAGHEHSLQLIKDSSHNYIVSGGGVNHNRVSKNKRTPFATALNGFAVLEVSTNKNVRVTFYTISDTIQKAYSEVIQNFATIQAPSKDSSTRVVENSEVIKYTDAITISGSDQYDSATWAKKIMVGTNYRKEWSTPVKMKVFNIHEEKGGLTIESLGGGKQTKSLTLKDKKGKEWKLRTIDKNPVNAIPEEFRNTLASKVVQDFISASHPYAPLTIPPLAKALGLVTANPELFFVPDDPAFGIYQPLFANTVCLLEEKDPSRNGENTKSTFKVFNTLTEEHDHRADQPTALRARLLDILIGDFDRHFDQWKWATTDTGKGKLYYPIPKDRDQAYFYSNGLMLRAAQRQLPMLMGFRHYYPKVKWLSWPARDFDRLFLTDLDKEEWKKEIKTVQQTLTDSLIRASVKKLPPEIYKMDSALITGKLISRRDLLMKAGLHYYKYLSRKVNVVGSNEKEYFKVTSDAEGLHVRVYARENNNDTSFIMYDRIFDSKVTKSIRLYGLNGDDKFEIDSNARSKIRLLIIGGKGNDTFDIKGKVINYLYDLTTEKNFIQHRNRTRNLFSAEPPVNYYSILGFEYNYNRFPKINIGYNIEDGLFIGPGFIRRTYGFRNRPYATEQRFATLYALNKGAYQWKYKGEFNHFFRNNDLLVNLEYVNPTLNNFFGLGNKTKISPQYGLTFYRTRYNYALTELLFRKRIYERLHLMIGPSAFRYWIRARDNTEKILGHPSLFNLDSARLYKTKTYLGGKFVAYFDNLNNQLFPTRGVLWNNEFLYQAGMSKGSNNFSRFTSDMSIYASLAEASNFIAVVRLGAGHVLSKNFEYFQALNLGANNFLRGFRKTRFYGTSMAYNSLELRIKLVDVKSYLFPGALGLVVFNDVGRVWLKGETSHKWHDAYGAGLYFTPFKLVIISATFAFSEEEKLFNFSVGTRINLTF